MSEHVRVSEVQSEVRVPIQGKGDEQSPSPSTGTQRLDIGFTGTQDGMSGLQRAFAGGLLAAIAHKHSEYELWAHHGDCIGADEQFGILASNTGFKIHLHPPKIDLKRAFSDFNEIEQPRFYRHRNQDIVDAASLLIATPAQVESSSLSKRSGTWMTVRMARRVEKPYVIIQSNGYIEGGNGWEKFLK